MNAEKKTYGPVQDGKITHLAVTGVAAFNPDEEGCPAKWYFDVVEKRPRVEKPWHTTGTDVDDQINHYLPTGQNVLGKIARAGIHLLPEPGADLLVQWGLNNKLRPKKPDGRWQNFFPPQESRLWAAGVPFIGFPDLINAREQYLVPSDDTIHQRIELKYEPGVVEVLDNKTSSNFKWAVPSDKLITKTQMNGYGLFVVEIEPSVVGVRLTHNVYRTDEKMAPAATKRSALVSAKELRDRWSSVVEPLVERMKSVAGEKNVANVEANLGACESFGGCSHRDYCPHHKKLNPLTRMKMSTLLKNRPAPGAVAAAPSNGSSNTPWIPPQPPAPPAAALPIMQQQAAPPPPPQAPPMPPQTAVAPPMMAPPPMPVAVAVAAPAPAPVAAAAGPAPIAAQSAVQNARYWVNGVMMQYLCSTNGKQAFMPIVNGQMQGTPVHVTYETAIFAADAVAAPVPAPVAPPAPVATAPQMGPPPPAPPAAAAGEKRGRGRPRKLNVVDENTAAPAAPVAPAAPAAPVPAAQAAASAQSFTLFVNAVPNAVFIDLSQYVSDAVEQIREQFGVPDIRVAPDDSPIAFAKWRGVLAGLVRAEPPSPATYVAFTKGSEFTEIVVEALWPLAGPGSARAF